MCTQTTSGTLCSHMSADMCKECIECLVHINTVGKHTICDCLQLTKGDYVTETMYSRNVTPTTVHNRIICIITTNHIKFTTG